MGSTALLLFQRIKFSHFPLPSHWTGAGLVGSLFAFLLVWLGIAFQGLCGFAFLILLTALAIFVTGRAEKVMQEKDDPRIILDEIIGFFWATAFLPIRSARWILLVAFLLFRIFDLAKLPFPQAQRLRGGFGVVADDLGAGLLTNLLLQIWIRYIV